MILIYQNRYFTLVTHLTSSSDLKWCGILDILDLDQSGHQAMDLGPVKVLLRVLVLKLEIGKPEQRKARGYCTSSPIVTPYRYITCFKYVVMRSNGIWIIWSTCSGRAPSSDRCPMSDRPPSTHPYTFKVEHITKQLYTWTHTVKGNVYVGLLCHELMILHYENIQLGWSWAVTHRVHWSFSPIIFQVHLICVLTWKWGHWPCLRGYPHWLSGPCAWYMFYLLHIYTETSSIKLYIWLLIVYNFSSIVYLCTDLDVRALTLSERLSTLAERVLYWFSRSSSFPSSKPSFFISSCSANKTINRFALGLMIMIYSLYVKLP